MSDEYTPATFDVAVAYQVAGATTQDYPTLANRGAKYRPQFDRWLARVKAEALQEAASVSALPHRDELAQIGLAHAPVVSVHSGLVVGCRCMDRVFVRGQETWAEHLADAILEHLTGEDR